MKDNILLIKTKKFAIRIINLYKYLTSEKHEFILSKQLLRCGTSIGANAREGNCAQTKKDFISKMNIALKEVAETEYWIELLSETNYINRIQSKSILTDCGEIKAILLSIVKSSKITQMNEEL